MPWRHASIVRAAIACSDARCAMWWNSTGRDSVSDFCDSSASGTASCAPLAWPKLTQWPQGAIAAKFSSNASRPRPS